MNKGTPVEPEHVCIRFRRAPISLIEEPEVCENCDHWDNGLCLREEPTLQKEEGL